MTMQCPNDVDNVRCIRKEGHEGDCQPPVVIEHDIITPREWRRLNAYGDDEMYAYAQELRRLCVDNIRLWNVAVLGNQPNPVFTELWDDIEGHDRLMVEMYRGCGKTTTFSNGKGSHRVGYALAEGTEHYDKSNLILRGTNDVAERKNGAAVRKIFDNNDLVRLMFLDELEEDNVSSFESYAKTWTDGIIDWGISVGPESDPTLECSGIDSNITGAHPDAVYCDDMVTEDNSRTQHQRDIIKKRWKQTIRDMIDPLTSVVILYTPYYENDLHEYLKKSGGFKHVKKPAMNRAPKMSDIKEDGIVYEDPSAEHPRVVGVELKEKACEELESAWPCPNGTGNCITYPKEAQKEHYGTVGHHVSVESLVMRWLEDPHGFMQQRMLQLTPEEGALVDDEMVRFWVWPWDQRAGKECDFNETEIASPDLNSIISVVHAWDHAVGGSSGSSETAHAMLAKDRHQNVYAFADSGDWSVTDVIDMMRTRYDTDPFCEEDACGKGSPDSIVTEGINFQEDRAAMLEEDAILPIKTVKSNRNKAQAFIESNLQAWMNRGKFFIHKDEDETLQQLRMFTGEGGYRDDRVDAIRLAFDEIRSLGSSGVRSHRARRSNRRSSGRRY